MENGSRADSLNCIRYYIREGSKYERSSIEFPYGDLNDAVGIAQAIQRNAGTSCSLSQLAAFVGAPISSGAFRLRVSNARIYGLTENARREVILTPLGRRIADPVAEANARVDAFLHVAALSADLRASRRLHAAGGGAAGKIHAGCRRSAKADRESAAGIHAFRSPGGFLCPRRGSACSSLVP